MVKEKQTINEKIRTLEQNIEWFYSDDFNLDEATERYEKAIKESREIEGELERIKNKIEVLEKDFTKD